MVITKTIASLTSKVRLIAAIAAHAVISGLEPLSFMHDG